MSTPSCPVHRTPMKFGRGQWYCPRRVNDKDEPDPLFCDQKRAPDAAFPAPSKEKKGGTAGNPAQPSTQQAPSLTVAALEFAGRVYQGTGSAEEALTLVELTIEKFGG